MPWSQIREATAQDRARLELAAARFIKVHGLEGHTCYTGHIADPGSLPSFELERTLNRWGMLFRTNHVLHGRLTQLWRSEAARALQSKNASGIVDGYVVGWAEGEVTGPHEPDRLTARTQATAPKPAPLTVIVPAYSEEGTIADTIRSLKRQTVPPSEVIVVDDCSKDRTGEVARACGARVVRPPTNTGSKAGAQTFALPWVTTEYTAAIDADTTVASDGLEKLLYAFSDPGVAAASGFVIPRRVKTLWERGRYIEYLLAFTWYKPIQDYYGKPLISSGCFSAYRTKVLLEVGGWSGRTMAEDMDLTWQLYQRGFGVRFMPDAVCFPVEPYNYRFMSQQLRRWSHGFVQNVKLHGRRLTGVHYLRAFVGVAMWDAVVASAFYLFVLPLLAILTLHPIYLIAYVIDVPVVVVPVAYQATRRGELGRALLSVPSFFVLRTINAIFILRALFAEMVVKRRLTTYEKGH